MSEQLAPYSALDPSRIDKHDYTNTLMIEALRAGVLTEEEDERIRSDFLTALSNVIGYYTEQESTSLRVDTARELGRSLIYNVDTCLRAAGSHEKAIALLKDRRVTELYGKGYLINAALLREAKTLYGKVRLTRLRDGGEAYDRTIDRYYRYYLSHYNPKFGAHDKIYLRLPRYRIAGNFNIRQSVAVLRRLLEINEGPHSDVILTPDAPGEESETKTEQTL